MKCRHCGNEAWVAGCHGQDGDIYACMCGWRGISAKTRARSDARSAQLMEENRAGQSLSNAPTIAPEEHDKPCGECGGELLKIPGIFAWAGSVCDQGHYWRKFTYPQAMEMGIL